MAGPLIVVDPQPRGLDEIFDAPRARRFEGLGELVVHDGAGRCRPGRFERHLPEMALLIGQTDMPRRRLERAGKLRGIINVETNFLQNIDYETCFRAGRPRAHAEFGLRAAGRGNGARHGDRPLPRRQFRRPRDPRRCREMAAGRGARVLLALWQRDRPGRFRRSRARLRPLSSLRLSGQGLRSLGLRSFHGRAMAWRGFARRGALDSARHRRVRQR